MSPAAKISRHARLQIGVTATAIDGQSGLFASSIARTPNQRPRIRFQACAIFQFHPIASMASTCPRVEDDAVLLMERAHEIAHLWTEDALHRPFFRCYTWTSIPRVRKAAHSSPMKLAPITTAACRLGGSMMACVGKVRSV